MSAAASGVTLEESAPAKINLFLHVLGRRADGYHLLDGLVSFADVGDRLSAAPAAGLTLAAAGPFARELPPDARGNLVWRAAEALTGRLGVSSGAAITLTKNLPVASGIGGGSSDAAAALRLLSRLLGKQLDAAALGEIASALGSDVPVCLRRAPSWFGGCGDAVSPAPALPDVAIVLANPGIALPTAQVYRNFRGPYSEPARFVDAPRDAAALAALLRARRNDLAPAALRLVPAIDDVLRALAACDGALLARMSGSGATCFALFASGEAAGRAAAEIAARNPSWWVRPGRLLRSADDAARR